MERSDNCVRLDRGYGIRDNFIPSQSQFCSVLAVFGAIRMGCPNMTVHFRVVCALRREQNLLTP